MSQKAYKFWRIKRWREAWIQLSEEERNRIFAEMKRNLGAVGGRWILRCTCSWANEEYYVWGVNEYPSLEAAVEDGDNLRKMGWRRYLESESMLGLPFEEG
jgi:hypothetical protein